MDVHPRSTVVFLKSPYLKGCSSGQVFRFPLAPLPHLFTRLIPKRRVSNAIISSLARIRFSMLRIQVSCENQFVYIVLNFFIAACYEALVFNLSWP